jgi:predicted small lipoprotein YifL
VRTAAALIAVLALAGCGGDGPAAMSLEEADRTGNADAKVEVKGTLVHAYGNTLLCASLVDEQGSHCGEPSLWVQGRLDENGWRGRGSVRWKGPVTLRGFLVDGTLIISR